MNAMSALERFLLRLALRGRLPFARKFLAWHTQRFITATEPSSALYTEFMIPDPERPIPKEKHGAVGPSAELTSYVPKILALADIVDREVQELSTILGTYGMGGPGFLGLKMDDEWLVIAIWGASEWVTVDDVLIQDHFHNEAVEPALPWITDDDDRLSPKLIGAKIISLQIEKQSMRSITIND